MFDKPTPYVINEGANDAYVRIRVMVPSAANGDFVAVKDGGVITNQWCTTSIKNGEFIDGKGGGWNNAPAIERNVDKDGMKYDGICRRSSRSRRTLTL